MPRQRILVVDDEEDVRELLGRILADQGFDVDLAEDGGPAIEALQRRRADLVLLDLMMPTVEGWAVLEQLHRMPAPPAVVVLTARGDHETLARGLREGIDSYVIKPFEIPELLATCRRVLAEPPAVPATGERRRTPRRSVVVEAAAHGPAGSVLARGSLVSLGPGGARLMLDAALDLGSRFALSIRTLDAGQPLRLEAEVRWREPRGPRYATGVAFVGASVEAARRLGELFPDALAS